MAPVTLTNIKKSFGSAEIIRGVSIDIADGEFVALVGPSGCGKSTILRMIAGLEPITDGRLKIGDRIVNELEPKDRDIAMVFQNYALYPHMTVEKNMAFSLEHRGASKAEIAERVRWAADILGLKDMLQRRPGQLSGGQRQRVAMGRAIVRDPAVFLFDEPLSNLDAKLRTETRLEIKRLHDETRSTVVYVTHDQIEAMTMATRIAVMNAGVIQQFGTPDEVYDRPANLFVAGFIGAPPMNLIDATVTGGGMKAKVGADGGEVDLGRYPFETRPRDGDAVVLGLRPEHFSTDGTLNGAGAARRRSRGPPAAHCRGRRPPAGRAARSPPGLVRRGSSSSASDNSAPRG